MKRAVHVIISGRVQGVWYRGWTQKTARTFSLNGWVKNCADGTVEAMFYGPDDIVKEMLQQCLDGPPLSNVSDIEIQSDEVHLDIEGHGFHIR